MSKNQPNSALSCSVLFFFLVAALFTTDCGGTPPPRGVSTMTTATVSAAPNAVSSSTPALPSPPTTRRDDVSEVLHGVTIIDPYRWLEDQESQDTRTWIDAQNAYTHSLLDPLPGREAIRARFEALARFDDQGLPTEHGGRYFIWQKRASDELWSYHVKHGLQGRDDVLLDAHPLSVDHTTSVGAEAVSNDGALVVYSVRRRGEDEVELRVKDVASLTDRPEVFPRALYNDVSFEVDNAGFYYTVRDRANGGRVRYHAIGTTVSRDLEVFGAGYGPSDWMYANVSRNGRHVLYTVSRGWSQSDIFVQDTPAGRSRARPPTAPQAIKPVVRGLGAKFEAKFADDHLIVETDFQAPNGRIVEIDVAHPSPDRWREIVPTGRDAIQDFDLVGGHILVRYLHDVSSRLALFALDGTPAGDIALPGLGNVTHVTGHWENDEIFVGFTSYTTPQTTLRGSVKTRVVAPSWQRPVPFASADYETTQEWFASKDGTRVPMFIVKKKGMALDGNRPTLLYGYGGFNISRTPIFSPWSAWFLEQGGIWAVANIRGGGEFGEDWHRAGMLGKKQNVFDDFIAAAEWLIAHRHTNAERLAIEGGSNGGLLVAAALTQRPDLFRAVLCEFPDLDMIGYPRFKNNNPPALLEYGDSSKPDEFKFLIAYSPYQKVTNGTRYPAVLLVSGDGDTRAPPLQARKMTARLQAASATPPVRPTLLLYDAKAGHVGGKSQTRWIEDMSLQLAFLAWQLGMPTSAP